ncbi:MAG: phosphodiester glycosidase family protein [Selenomonadaceae bacterium]|nr:phosphodiester glycosidase family protein [Selenomonadaceae bacterium]
MLRLIAALFTAAIFFLTSPCFTQASNYVPSEPPEGVPRYIDDDEDNTPRQNPNVQSEPPEGVPRYIDDDEDNTPRQNPNVQSEPPEGVPYSIDDNTQRPEKPYKPEKPYEPQTPINEPEPPIYNPPSPNLDDDGQGLEFLVYNQNGVMAFAVIADHERYQLRPVLAGGKIPGLSRLSTMDMPGAIATVNASYFAPNGTIYGNTRIDGLTASTTYLIRSAIGIMADGSTIFARQSYRGTVNLNGEEYVVSGINCSRNKDTLIVYNKFNGTTTGTNEFGTEVIVQNGQITNVIHGAGNSYIPSDGFVVSANGAAAEFLANAQIGDSLIFDEDFINVEYTGDFNEAVHILGAGPTLVKNGKIYVSADAEQFPSDIRLGRAPRSAVGVTQYGDYILAVVDGRQAHSKGCTLTEWARILVNEFGAVEAINLDGGGSTELIVRGSLVNKPSDGRERSVGSALTIVRR